MAKKVTQKDYEKQYQLYLQQLKQREGQKGANAATGASNQVGRDYIFPTIKAVGSLTPVGVAIGLTDAYNAYKSGDNIGAMIGAGLEALPYGLKYAGKGAKALLKKIPTNKIDDFVSEINWGKFNKEIPDNLELLKEYNTIEESTKKAGTWMKNPDGSAFQGTPEQFVQQNSENFKKAFLEGSNISYRGDLSKISEIKSQQELGKEAIKRKYNLTDDDSEALEKLWSRAKDKLNSGKYTTNEYEAALKYAKGDKNKVLSLYTDIRNPKFTETGESFRVLEKDRQKLLSEGYDALITKPSSFYPEGENVLLKNNQIKSAVGNNGMFDMTNPNIYKTVIPAAIGAKALTTNKEEYKSGGQINNMKKITKNINAKFNPTLLDGYNIYNYGGRMMYDVGGMMMPGGMLDMSPYIEQSQAGLPIGVGQGANVVGQGVEDITNAYRPNKANYGSNIGGGALKGAATGAAIGSIVPGVGTVVGGVVGGAAGAISGLSKSIVKGQEIKREKENYQLDLQDNNKRQLISNLPGQSSYVPTFANGGEITDRVTSFENGGLHSENGGIPIGQNAMVERDEFLYTNKAGKKYVFSNKLFR